MEDEKLNSAPPFALVVALVAIAGWVDAVGYLQLGHQFISFMSGNTTQMAVGLGRGHWSEAGILAAIIFLFVAGVVLGTLLAQAVGKWRLPAVLGVEAILLVMALLLPAPVGPLPLAALPVILAMGLQNAALEHLGKKNVSLTYVTGTLVGIGRGLAAAVGRKGEPWGWCTDLTLWLGMATGAVAGAIVFAWLGFWCLLIPLAVVTVLAIVATLSAR